ncbi:MAG: hypothetical protein K0S37_796 [Microbacterium sp.]|jgi:hypothetical protein|nr:hypothetical protein [Microbacterium sp.]
MNTPISAQTEPRGFAATLADFDKAANSQRYALTSNTDIYAAADRLPLSEWGENARAGMERAAAENPHTGGGRMTPQTVAMNWRANVSDTAHELREALAAWGALPAHGDRLTARQKIDAARNMRTAARALLRALGELPTYTENDAERTAQ